MLTFKLNWPDMVHDFLSSQQSAGSVTGRVFTLDCFL